MRTLTPLVKLAVDRAMHNPTPSALAELDRVLEGNEASVRSSHVWHNLAARRQRWLAQYMKERNGTSA